LSCSRWSRFSNSSFETVSTRVYFVRYIIADLSPSTFVSFVVEPFKLTHYRILNPAATG
jgi:hypothetical protein